MGYYCTVDGKGVYLTRPESLVNDFLKMGYYRIVDGKVVYLNDYFSREKQDLSIL